MCSSSDVVYFFCDLTYFYSLLVEVAEMGDRFVYKFTCTDNGVLFFCSLGLCTLTEIYLVFNQNVKCIALVTYTLTEIYLVFYQNVKCIALVKCTFTEIYLVFNQNVKCIALVICTLTEIHLVFNQNVKCIALVIFLFIWGFTSLSTLYRSYHDG